MALLFALSLLSSHLRNIISSRGFPARCLSAGGAGVRACRGMAEAGMAMAETGRVVVEAGLAMAEAGLALAEAGRVDFKTAVAIVPGTTL